MTLLFNLVFWLGVSAIGCRIFGAGSSFRVGWCTMGGGGLIAIFWDLFAGASGVFVLAGWGAGHWAMILWGLDNFLIFSHFLRS